MARQITVFAENKPGRLERITRILKEKQVNIRAVTIGSSDKFGVVKLLVDKPDIAYQALTEGGVSASLREILPVLMNDAPGGLHHITEVLGRAGINIEDAYGFVIQDRRQAVLVMEVGKPAEVQRLLEGQGLKTLSDEEIYSL